MRVEGTEAAGSSPQWAAIAGIIATVTVFAVAQGLTYPLLCRCLKAMQRLRYAARMSSRNIAVTPSRRTLHAELLRLCARIGYSPPAFC